LIINKMAKTPYIFTGAGNNFVVFDGREGGMEEYRQPERIQALCREYATDGLMILTEVDAYDFSMEFYNPDGSGGMMCGNGGRCIVAFADYLGLKPAAPDGTWHFLAPDGPHTAKILEGHELGSPIRSGMTGEQSGITTVMPGPDRASHIWTVRLKMIDVKGVKPVRDGYFLNTGTRHYVQFVEDVDAIDMEQEAKPIRWADDFQPEGTNVNFVQVTPQGLKVRTFEKGVEGETLACGTGLTASAIAAYFNGIPDQVRDDGVAVGENRHARPRPGISYHLQCRRGDWLQVEFKPDFTDVYLTGPAEII
jgi:diaminopimelate epimerase